MLNLIDSRQVRAELESRYGSRRQERRARRSSSLEVTRRVMHRRSQQELHPELAPTDD